MSYPLRGVAWYKKGWTADRRRRSDSGAFRWSGLCVIHHWVFAAMDVNIVKKRKSYGCRLLRSRAFSAFCGILTRLSHVRQRELHILHDQDHVSRLRAIMTSRGPYPFPRSHPIAYSMPWRSIRDQFTQFDVAMSWWICMHAYLRTAHRCYAPFSRSCDHRRTHFSIQPISEIWYSRISLQLPSTTLYYFIDPFSFNCHSKSLFRRNLWSSHGGQNPQSYHIILLRRNSSNIGTTHIFGRGLSSRGP